MFRPMKSKVDFTFFQNEFRSYSLIWAPRLILMRSDAELQIFIFRSENIISFLMQSDSAKSDGTKSDLRIRWRESSDVEDSAHRVLKSKNGIGL